MRRPRSDSKLKNLPEDQGEQLTDWLLAGVPYREIKRRMLEAFKVETSTRALSEYWQTECAAALVARRQRAIETADAVADEAAANPGRFDAATVDALKQKAFELAINPQSAAKDVKGLFMLVLKARDQELDVERLAFERDKFKLATQKEIEKGLDALFAEIEGNAQAEAIFEQLKDAALKAVEEV